MENSKLLLLFLLVVATFVFLGSSRPLLKEDDDKFNEADKDGDGLVSLEELSEAMTESSSHNVPIMIVQSHMSYADKDGDGNLDREEFKEVPL